MVLLASTPTQLQNPPLANADTVRLLTAHLLNNHYHHSSTGKAQENVVVALLNLFISTCEALICTLGILDAALHLLSATFTRDNM